MPRYVSSTVDEGRRGSSELAPALAHHEKPLAGLEHAGALARTSTFMCLPPRNPMRYHAIRLVHWPPFDRVILLSILVNSVLMGMQDYTVFDTKGGASVGTPHSV
jgi:hypothetical protein